MRSQVSSAPFDAHSTALLLDDVEALCLRLRSFCGIRPAGRRPFGQMIAPGSLEAVTRVRCLDSPVASQAAAAKPRERGWDCGKASVQGVWSADAALTPLRCGIRSDRTALLSATVPASASSRAMPVKEQRCRRVAVMGASDTDVDTSRRRHLRMTPHALPLVRDEYSRAPEPKGSGVLANAILPSPAASQTSSLTCEIRPVTPTDWPTP